MHHPRLAVAGGFSPNQFKEVRLPTLAELDAAVPDNPVFVMVGGSPGPCPAARPLARIAAHRWKHVRNLVRRLSSMRGMPGS
jgi:hypothetical protein